MRRLLVAEPDPLCREALRVLVESTDDLLLVAEAGDGDAALAAATRTRPDAVVADARLRTGDGETLAQALARGPARCPVVTLASFPDELAPFASPPQSRGAADPAGTALLRDAGVAALLQALRAAAAPSPVTR